MKIKKIALSIYRNTLFRASASALGVIVASNIFAASLHNTRFASVIASAMLAGG